MRFGLITEQSRKSRAAKSLFEYIRSRPSSTALNDDMIATWPVQSGVHVGIGDRFRIVDLKLHEEHLSPYFKTDMNLFHLLMLDDKADMSIYRTPEGILFAFEGLPESPEPFGARRFDTR